jgi:hypothetical protein
MKDPVDTRTPDLLKTTTKQQRFREKQMAAGKRQYSFWLTHIEAIAVKGFIEGYLSEPKDE